MLRYSLKRVVYSGPSAGCMSTSVDSGTIAPACFGRRTDPCQSHWLRYCGSASTKTFHTRPKRLNWFT